MHSSSRSSIVAACEEASGEAACALREVRGSRSISFNSRAPRPGSAKSDGLLLDHGKSAALRAPDLGHSLGDRQKRRHGDPRSGLHENERQSEIRLTLRVEGTAGATALRNRAARVEARSSRFEEFEPGRHFHVRDDASHVRLHGAAVRGADAGRVVEGGRIRFAIKRCCCASPREAVSPLKESSCLIT